MLFTIRAEELLAWSEVLTVLQVFHKRVFPKHSKTRFSRIQIHKIKFFENNSKFRSFSLGKMSFGIGIANK